MNDRTGVGSTDELKQDARQLKDKAVDQATAKAEVEKDRAARTANSTASAIDSAAEELRQDDNAPDWLASAFSSVARQVGDIADRLQGKDASQLARETRSFAKDNPTAFLAASAAAGFAAARFLRAGAEEHDDFDIGDDDTGSRYRSVTPAVSSRSADTGTARTTPTVATGNVGGAV